VKLFETLSNTFAAPGFGVYTVHAGASKRKNLSSILYPHASNEPDVIEAWHESLKTIADHQGVLVYGIPSDSGGGIQRGANWGPLAVREKLYPSLNANERKKTLDLGDVRTNPHLLLDEYLNDQTLSACKKAMHGNEHSIYSVSPLSIAGDAITLLHHHHPEKKIFMIGGDHSVSYPAVKEFLRHQKNRGKNAAIIHFDAHTDLLDERLGISVCFGSWASQMIPELSHPSQLIQVGIRSSGKDKNYWEKTKGVTQYWANEMNQHGPQAIANAIASKLKLQKVDLLYISFDIDALDAEEAGATGTPEIAGLMTDDCITVIELLSREFQVFGADLVEVAPFVHHPHLKNSENEPENTLNNASAIAQTLIRAMMNSTAK
jgi:agmatinase